MPIDRMPVLALIQIFSFLGQRLCTERYALVSATRLFSNHGLFYRALYLFMVTYKLINLLEPGEGGYVVCYEMEDIKKKLGLGRNSLVT